MFLVLCEIFRNSYFSKGNCYYSVTKSCLTLCYLMDSSTPDTSVLYCLQDFAQIMSIETVMLSNHLIICCPLLLLP